MKLPVTVGFTGLLLVSITNDNIDEIYKEDPLVNHNQVMMNHQMNKDIYNDLYLPYDVAETNSLIHSEETHIHKETHNHK